MRKNEMTLDDYKALEIGSNAFQHNESIPRQYTCDGEDINPPLEIGFIPPEAKSMALIIEDPDAPGKTWLHWMVANIPITHHIKENETPGVEGANDFGRVDYGGPCPPNGKHRYFFKIYALDTILDLEEGFSMKELQLAMHNHVVAYGEIVGLYKRQRTE